MEKAPQRMQLTAAEQGFSLTGVTSAGPDWAPSKQDPPPTKQVAGEVSDKVLGHTLYPQMTDKSCLNLVRQGSNKI